MESETAILPIETKDGIAVLKVERFVINENDENVRVIISATIQEKTVAFESVTTEDALIQLARSLPEGWRIKSCLSCRHGHFCPVGDNDNEVFCVADFEPQEARDLWHVTEDEQERINRSHTLFDSCERYAPQSKAYFTYSDYYFRMNDKN